MLLEIPISPNDSGQRADRYLLRVLAPMGSGRLNALFRRREIKLARRPIASSQILQPGDIVQVYGLKPEEADIKTRKPSMPPRIPTQRDFPPILFEDTELLVVNKPSGMAAHPGTGIPPGASLIERIREGLPKSEPIWSGELFEPSLVHRLDKETSGVILTAKTGPSLRRLTAALREGRMRKRYLALVLGIPDPGEGTIDAELVREDSAVGGAKVSIVESGGKRSITHYRTLKMLGAYSLVQIIIETGRMHQIRAHFAHIGNAIAGDTRYNRPSEARSQQKELGMDRLFLHAEEMTWTEDGKVRRFQAPLPAELSAVVKRLEALAESDR